MYDNKLYEDENVIVFVDDECNCKCYKIFESKKDGSCILEGKLKDGEYKITKKNPFNNKQECIDWILKVGRNLRLEEKY